MIGQAFRFLREHNEGVLATVSGDRPQTRAFQAQGRQVQQLKKFQSYCGAGLGIGQGVVVVRQAVAAGLADGVELVVG